MTTRLVANLSEWSGLSISDITYLIATAPRRYKVFRIPKKSGNAFREIAQPSRELKGLQVLLTKRVLHLLPVHAAAQGYVKGKGIKSNAAAHVGNSFLLKMDIADFFPSIRPLDLRRHILRHSPNLLATDELTQVMQLLFWRRKGERKLRLCIGAPSSPFISNTLMYDLDMRLEEAARARGVTYTRYADDLAFSTNDRDVLPAEEARYAREIEHSRSPRLLVNRGKTVHISMAHRRMLTGIVLSAARELSIGRERKRLIRSMVHHKTLGELDQEQTQQLHGLLAFAHDVEPEFAATMRLRLERNYPQESGGG